ncbi:hypothetical protein [Phytoactinopolyspora limicola]|nr:hypothetical protein [Phytoactinopolyspora limicola]
MIDSVSGPRVFTVPRRAKSMAGVPVFIDGSLVEVLALTRR